MIHPTLPPITSPHPRTTTTPTLGPGLQGDKLWPIASLCGRGDLSPPRYSHAPQSDPPF